MTSKLQPHTIAGIILVLFVFALSLSAQARGPVIYPSEPTNDHKLVRAWELEGTILAISSDRETAIGYEQRTNTLFPFDPRSGKPKQIERPIITDFEPDSVTLDDASHLFLVTCAFESECSLKAYSLGTGELLFSRSLDLRRFPCHDQDCSTLLVGRSEVAVAFRNYFGGEVTGDVLDASSEKLLGPLSVKRYHLAASGAGNIDVYETQSNFEVPRTIKFARGYKSHEIVLSDDGRYLAAFQYEAEGQDGGIIILSADTGQMVSALDEFSSIHTVSFSSDGKKLLVAGAVDTTRQASRTRTGVFLRVYDVATGHVVAWANPDLSWGTYDRRSYILPTGEVLVSFDSEIISYQTGPVPTAVPPPVR